VTDALLTVAGVAADTGPNAAGVTEVLVSLNDAIASVANGTTPGTARHVAPRRQQGPRSLRQRRRPLSETKTIDVRYMVPRPANDDFGASPPLEGPKERRPAKTAWPRCSRMNRCMTAAPVVTRCGGRGAPR